MEIHGSTQLTVTDFRGAVAAKRMGMTRVVPARELSLAEIKRIKKKQALKWKFSFMGHCVIATLVNVF